MKLPLLLLLSALAALAPIARAADGDVEASFNPNANSNVLALAVQRDGGILLGGDFITVSGINRYRIARLSANGTLDSNYDPEIVYIAPGVYDFALQADDMALVGGSFKSIGGGSTYNLARLHTNGLMDTSYKPGPGGPIYCLVVERNGGCLAGGWVRINVPAGEIFGITRIDAAGTLDPTFFLGLNGYVDALALQEDDKFLIGGKFTKIGTSSYIGIARFNPDGTLEAGFNPSLNSNVWTIALQADGKILVGGAFTSIAGTPRNRLARLNADGSLDSGFNPDANAVVRRLVVQADGKILVGGDFTSVAGTTRNRIARLNSNGTLDAAFNPNADNKVMSLCLQPNGRILMGGYFSTVGGQTRNRIARLLNGTAAQTLSVPNSTRVEWLRSGTTPEIGQVTFDLSTDGGSTWSSLGNGARIAGRWQLTGLSLPETGVVRARGRASDGVGNGNLIETLQSFDFGTNNISLIATGSVWKYLDTGTNLGTAWKETNFNDSAWASGPAQLGYGDGDEATVVSFGTNSSSKYITTYFRRSFSLPDTSWITNLAARYIRDDGAVVYLNGVEVFRSNMPGGVVGYTTLASSAEDSAIENNFHTKAIPARLLVPGTNVIAVEIHQNVGTSSDLSFELELIANTGIIRTSDPLPPPWVNLDVGGPGLAGSASYVTNNPVWLVQSGGGDIYGTNDQCHFVYDSVLGNCEIRARVAALGNSSNWAKAGVMIRDTLLSNSRSALMALTPVNGTEYVYRTNAGATATPASQSGPTPPYWVRLVRSGSTVTGYTSPEGSNWTQVFSTTLSLSNRVLVGLAVASVNSTRACLAAFDQVSGLSPAANHADIGSPAIAGSFSLETNPPSFLVQGGGSDIYDYSDEFHYVYQTVTGDCAIQARVAAQSYIHSAAKAGLMLREALTPNARHFFMAMTPSDGAYAVWRASTGGLSGSSGDSTNTAPYWLRLVRQGGTLAGYKSMDGVNWWLVPSLPFRLADSLYVGMTVTARNNPRTCLTAFDSVAFVPTVNAITAVGGPVLGLGEPVEFHADCAHHDGQVVAVRYYLEGTNFIGAANTPPFVLVWTNAPPGLNYISARAVDDKGVEGAPLLRPFFVAQPDTHFTFYPEFAPTNGLILQSDAVLTNGALRVSQAHANTAGGAWLPQARHVAAGFECVFQFQLNNASSARGDGFAFLIEGGSVPRLGGVGGSIGYDGVSNSVAVEFDTAQNPERGDPNDHHISIHTRGTLANTVNESASIGSASGMPDFADSKVHTAKITYAGGVISVYLDSFDSPVITAALSLTNTLSLPDGRAWIGFTAAGGSGYQNHDILNWAFVTTNLHPAVTLTAPTNGAVFLPSDSVTLTAAATDLDGTIQQVVFFVDGNYVGSATNSPWQLPVGALPAGPHVLNAGALDDSGAATVSAPVTILVNTPPVAQCRHVTVPASGLCTALATIDAGSYDVDFQDDFTLTQSPPAPYPLGTTVVTLTVTDTYGASNACTATVTVVDTTPPTITCPADLAVDTAPGACASNVVFTVGATDNCGAVSVLCVPPSGSAFGVGTTLTLCTATDGASNTASCTFSITVRDAEPPQIICPTNLVVDTSPGTCASNVTFTATAADNCGAVVTACAPPSGSEFVKGTTPVNCTTTDNASNTVSCTFNVTVNDTEPPAMTCPTDITVSTAPGACASNVVFIVGATDNCGTVGTACVPPSGSEFAKGTTPVTCTATDSASNTVSCTFSVTVNDTEPPAITCSANITVSTAPGACASNVVFTVGATDNCGAVSVLCVPPSGSEFAKGTTLVTCTATDSASNAMSCTFNVTVSDTEPPAITCPANITVSTAPGACASNVTFTVMASDNCGAVSVLCVPPSGSAFAKGTTPVTCIATDGASNTVSCTFSVTVNDSEPPQIVCPAGITVDTALGSCASNVAFAATATDNCGAVSTACVPPSGSAFAKGTTLVICTTTDGANHTNTCTFTVTVLDNEPPVITCPADIVVSTAPGSCFSNVVFGVTAADNCGTAPVLCVPPSGSAFAVGATFVNCAATDPAGHSNVCTFTVTVNDTEPPQIVCPTNLVASADAGQCSRSHVAWTVRATDNCTVTNLVCVPASDSTFAVGPRGVACTATDASGNTASCNFTVTILDSEPPQLVCPADLVVNPPTDNSATNATFTVTATDNCDTNPAVVCVPPSGSGFTNGTTVIHCTVTDTAGNSNACSFTLRVNARPQVTLITPTNAAVFLAPASISLLADALDPDGDGVAQVDFFTGTNWLGAATSGYLYIWSNAPAGVHALTARATDGRGATGTSAAVTITVLAQPPTTYAPVTSSNLNRQTGLYVQPVRISNPTATALEAFRLWVALDTNSLAHNVRLWNATGTSNGLPFVLHNQPLLAGESVVLNLEYYIPDRRTMPNPVFTVEVLPAVVPPHPTGTPLEVDRALRLSTGWFRVEFSTQSNRTYYVQYSSDASAWQTALPAVSGTGQRVSWLDAGPPKTASDPATATNRFYRVLLLP